MNQDPILLIYIVFVAIYMLMENIVMARLGARMHVSRKDTTLLLVLVPFYLVMIVAPLEYLAVPHASAIGFLITGGIFFVIGTIMRTKAHLDLGKAFSVSINRRDGGAVIKTGLYRTIRHPLYLANLLIMIAAPIFLADTLTWLATCLGLAGILARIRLEERFLQQEYPDYSVYIEKTWKLIPWIY